MQPISPSPQALQAESQDLLGNLQRLQSVLTGLQASHQRLEERAKRMEAELEVSNRQLGEKVQELDQTNQYLEAILASLPSGVVVRNAERVITRTNPAFDALLQAPQNGWIASQADLPLSPAKAGLMEGVGPQGEKRLVNRTESLVFDGGGQAIGSVEIVSDQTDLARATARMHQQSKMAGLGSMAGGIAHEIRNPMNAVRGFAGLLRRPGVAPEDQARYAQRIEAGVQEVEGIIASLLRLATPSGLHLETLQSDQVLGEALTLVQREENAQDIQWQLEAQSLALPADRIQLRQALRNLIANALQAQSGQGPLLLRCRAEGDQVVFEVHDSGPGMAGDDPRRCIDPFYTTRAEGMGLGLSLVDSIARLHGGELDLSSESSQLGGALVRLILPTS